MKSFFNRKSISLLTVLMFSAILIVFSSGSANADSIYKTSVASGDWVSSRSSSSGGGITATPDWDNGAFSFGWNITKSGEFYTYVYNITTTGKDLSHSIIEVTAGTPASDYNITEWTGTTELRNYLATESGNPLMPNDIYGIKFDKSDVKTYLITIITKNAPLWGVFYAKDGKVGGVDTVAYSNALANFNSDNKIDYIARPNGPIKTPEPATMLLLGTGLFGLAVIRRRFKK